MICDIFICKMWCDVIGGLECVTVVNLIECVMTERPRVVGAQRRVYFAGMWHLINSKSSS